MGSVTPGEFMRPSLDPVQLENSWIRPFELAWEAFVAGTTPIGAVITTSDRVVAEGRGRRLEKATVPGQLSSTRIAHAEVNALAQLSVDGDYRMHSLWATVEPCCLCMGAAIQTGIGRVMFAQADPYAGASSIAPQNPQYLRLSMAVERAAPGIAPLLSDLLMIRHYRVKRHDRLPHVMAPMLADRPTVFDLASAPDVDASFIAALNNGESVAQLLERLGASLRAYLATG